MEDFLKLKVGTILDIITVRLNNIYDAEQKAKENKETKTNKKEEIRMATKNDNIMSFF